MKKLLVFSSTTCGPCKMMAPIVDKVTQELGLEVQKYDVHTHTGTSRQYNVTAVPTFILLKDGEEVDRLVGATPLPKFKQFLEV